VKRKGIREQFNAVTNTLLYFFFLDDNKIETKIKIHKPDLRVDRIFCVFPCAQVIWNISPFDKIHFFGLLCNPV